MDVIPFVIVTFFNSIGNVTNNTLTWNKTFSFELEFDKNHVNDLIMTTLKNQHEMDIKHHLTDYPIFDGTVISVISTEHVRVGKYTTEFLDGLVTFSTSELKDPNWFESHYSIDKELINDYLSDARR